MARLDIAVDIGTSNTSIFVSGNGIVLHEPTLVAFLGAKSPKNVLAVGTAAYKMQGKLPQGATLVAPVLDGVIVDSESARILLSEFLKKVIPDSYFFSRTRVIGGIPTGLSANERAMYDDVIFGSHKSIKQVTLIENILLTGVGLQLPISSPAGALVVNIGGGTTEIAALSLNGIIAGCGLNLGGNLMDRAISDAITGRNNVKIELSTIKKLKDDIASLYYNDTAIRQTSGLDLNAKTVIPTIVRAADMYDTLNIYYTRIADAVENILNMCPSNAAAEFNAKGVHIAGGGAKVLGIQEAMYNKLGIKAAVAKDSEFAAVLGAGKLLNDNDLLNNVLAYR